MAVSTLNQLRQAIIVGDYALAEQILSQVNHHKREYWLSLLEQTVRHEKLLAIKKPWNPSFLASLSFAGSPIISSGLLAWNWRRMGKSDWALPTFAVQFMLIFLLVLGGLIIFKAFPEATSFDPVIVLLIFVGSLSGCFPHLIGNQQSAAYKMMNKKGYLAMREYPYRWGKAIAIYMLVATVITGAILLLRYPSTLGETITGSTISVERLWNWTSYDISPITWCQDDANFDCFVYFVGGQGAIVIAEIMDPPYDSARDYRDMSMQGLEGDIFGFDTISLGGNLVGEYFDIIEDKVFKTYYWIDFDNGERMLMVMYVSATLEQHEFYRSDVEEMLNSIQIIGN